MVAHLKSAMLGLTDSAVGSVEGASKGVKVAIVGGSELPQELHANNQLSSVDGHPSSETVQPD